LGAVLIPIKGYAAPQTGQVFAHARELWEQLGSPSEFLRLAWGQSTYHALRGELDFAQRLEEDFLRLSRQANDSAGLILGHLSIGRNLMVLGSFASSRAHLEQALALYDPISHGSLVQKVAVHPQVASQVWLGIVLLCLGFPTRHWHRAAQRSLRRGDWLIRRL